MGNQELVKSAAVENRLTGQIKLANEERDPNFRVDGDVKLMGNGDGGNGSQPHGGAAAGSTPSLKLPPPAALSSEAAKKFRPLKAGGNP